jgi:phosphopantothenate synthetase
VSVRIIALPAEAAAVAKVLAAVLPVVSVRGPYPCRGDDRQVRLYLEVQP